MEHDLASLHLKEVVPPLTEAKSHSRNEKKADNTNGNPFGGATAAADEMDIINAGEDKDLDNPPPRAWLLGNVFAKKFLSALLAGGGVGKTAVRYAQYLSLATGRSLTGEFVFCRSRVLICCFEDDLDELRRRIRAVMLHYGISRQDLKGWLFYKAVGTRDGKLASETNNGVEIGTLGAKVAATIMRHKIDLVGFDPFVKTHAVSENDNSAIDSVVTLLTTLAADYNIAVDVLHHTNKGTAQPGDADKGRGASAMKDGGRLVYTLVPMTSDEAERFGINDDEHHFYVRVDRGKVNLTPARKTKWFHLVGVPLGNGQGIYPDGDEVQTVEPWSPPDAWKDLTNHLLNRILDDIDAGLDDFPYSGARQATARGAWNVVLRHAPDRTEAQAKEIIGTWIKNKVLVTIDYQDKWAKPAKGVKSDPEKRPTT